MKLNNKGFTFVEVLGVIVILGILSSIAIIGVSRYQDKARQNDYDALARSSYNGMEEYLGNHPYAESINLIDLEEGQYISTLVDPATKNSKCRGAVEVNKGNIGDNDSLSDYQYTVYLCCANYKKKYVYPGEVITNIGEDEMDKCDLGANDIGEDTVSDIPADPGSVINCAAGKYLPKSKFACATCTNAHYCPGGEWTYSEEVDQGLKDCPTGYKNSAAGSSKITQCYMNVPNGKYVKKKKDPSPTTCVSPTFKATHNVYYDSISTCTNCPAGYKNSATGSYKASQCYMIVPKNNYVKKQKDPSPTKCATGFTKNQHNVYYGNKSECERPTITCAAGKYLPKAKSVCATCVSAYYCPGGKFKYDNTKNQGLTPCPNGYKNSAVGSSKVSQCFMKVPQNKFVKKEKDVTSTACGSGMISEAHNVFYGKKSSCVSGTITCAAGKYLPKSKTSCATCTGGNYCGGGKFTYNTSKDQGITACPTGYKNSAAGSSKVTQCYMNVSGGYHVASKKATSASQCKSGTYRASHTVYYDSTSSCSNCPSGYGNSPVGSSTNTQCYIKVSGGKFIKTKNSSTQTSCSAGTYKAAHNVNYGSTSSCSSCPAGYKKSAAGSSSIGNCYMEVPKDKHVKKAKDTSATACGKGYSRSAHNVYYGNTSACTLNAPKCSISLSPAPNSNGWNKSNVTVTLNINGAEYGNNYGLAKTEKPTNKKTTASVTSETSVSGVTFYGYVKNSKGSDTCSKTVKLDKTKPKLSKVYSGHEYCLKTATMENKQPKDGYTYVRRWSFWAGDSLSGLDKVINTTCKSGQGGADCSSCKKTNANCNVTNISVNYKYQLEGVFWRKNYKYHYYKAVDKAGNVFELKTNYSTGTYGSNHCGKADSSTLKSSFGNCPNNKIKNNGATCMN